MATQTIHGYTAAVTIDPTGDFFLIDPASSGNYLKINRNVALGITSSPAGISDSQTLTNKTITAPTISGPTLSGTILGTYTLGGTPTFPASVTTLTGSQTLTNKTLTAPTINGGAIDNTTITVDSISGHTTSTIVTVGGVQLNNGTIGTSGAVTGASIAAGAVTPNSLIASTGTGWSWQNFTPTWTNLTVGNGAVTASYIQTGKIVTGTILFILGTTSAIGTGPYFTPPVPASTIYNNGVVNYTVGSGLLRNSAAAVVAFTGSDTKLALFYNPTATTTAGLTATTPGTWATGDYFNITFEYQAA